MLALTGICIYMFSLSFIFGIMSVRIMNMMFKLTNDRHLPFTIQIINGLAIISIIVSILSIFIKTSLVTSVFLFVVSLIYCVIDYSFVSKEINKIIGSFKIVSLPGAVLLIVFISYFFLLAEMPSTNYDTNLYHSHLVKWHENYSAVPGLGNLHDRLASNSSWIVIAAAFSFSFLDIMSFNPLSHFLFLLISFYSIGGVNNLFRKNFNASNWIRSFILPITLYSYFFPHIGWVATPSPDVPTVIFTWIFFCFAMQIIEDKRSLQLNTWTISLIFIALFVMTIKLSGALLVLFPFFVFLRELYLKRYISALMVPFLVIVFIVPFLVRNVIFSGYLLFPYSAIDIFSFDWKIPVEKVKEMQIVIENWAKFPAWFRNVPEGATLDNMTFFQWYEVWLVNQTMPYLKELLTSIYVLSSLFIVGFIIYLTGVFTKIKAISKHYQENKEKMLAYVVVITIAILSFLFWLIKAPDLRFGWGVIFALAGILIFLPLQMLINMLMKSRAINFPQNAQTALYFLFSIVALYLFFSIYGDMRNLLEQRKAGMGSESYWNTMYLPPDYNISQLELEIVNGYKVYYSGTSGYSPIPSNNSRTSKKVFMRGNSFQDGFKTIEKE